MTTVLKSTAITNETEVFMDKIVKEALTYDDVLLIPGASSFTPNMADLTTKLSDDITLNIPLM